MGTASTDVGTAVAIDSTQSNLYTQQALGGEIGNTDPGGSATGVSVSGGGNINLVQATPNAATSIEGIVSSTEGQIAAIDTAAVAQGAQTGQAGLQEALAALSPASQQSAKYIIWIVAILAALGIGVAWFLFGRKHG